MTLRLVFGRDDLQRVRVATAADPMWELVLGIHRSQSPRLAATYLPWRQELVRRMPDHGPVRDALTMLRALVPPRGNFPDALTPPHVTELGAGLEALACTSVARLTADMRSVFSGRQMPTWARSLADGDRNLLRELVTSVRRGHRLLVEPQWTEIRHATAADRAIRQTHLTEHGVGHLLSSLPGVVRWDGAVLETRYPKNHTVRLNGRGLTLIPSYFCWGNPISLIDPELPPVLVYQADHSAGGHARMDLGLPPGLVSLLGRVRAECLRALANPLSTSQLADCLGVSVGTASKQATVLREAQLVTSRRSANAVIHSLTPLGTALLTGQLASD